MKKLFLGKWLYTADEKGSIVEDFAMLTEEGRIVWILPQKEADLSCAHICVDLKKKFVAPGFIDCHVHFMGSKSCRQVGGINDDREDAFLVCQGAFNVRQLMKAGIAACRDLGSYKGCSLGLRDGVEKGFIQGPRIQAAGRAICARGGHGFEISYEVDGEEQMQGAVRQVIKEGADIIKLMVSGGVNSRGPEPGPCELTEGEIRRGIETAHAWGRKAAVHAHGNTAIRRCVEAGVDSVEHGVFMTEDIMEQMAVQGTYFVPTLCAPYYAVHEGIKREPDNPDHKKSKEILRHHREVVRQCAEKGVTIAMGTDAGCPFNPYEKAAHEMVLLVEAGLTPRQAMDAATRNGAALLGLSDLGSLEAGKRATFVCLKANPFTDIGTVDDVEAFYMNGCAVNLQSKGGDSE